MQSQSNDLYWNINFVIPFLLFLNFSQTRFLSAIFSENRYFLSEIHRPMVWKKPMVPSAKASANRWIGRPLRPTHLSIMSFSTTYESWKNFLISITKNHLDDTVKSQIVKLQIQLRLYVWNMYVICICSSNTLLKIVDPNQKITL